MSVSEINQLPNLPDGFLLCRGTGLSLAHSLGPVPHPFKRTRLPRLSHTIPEVARMTGILQHQVRRLIVQGDLPAINVGTEQRATYIVPQRVLEDWLKTRSRLPLTTSEPPPP